MAPLRTLISSVLIFSFLPTVFHGPLRQVVRAEQDTAGQERGLEFRLSGGVGQPEVAKPPTQLAPASELSESETENILSRLPAMTVDGKSG